MGLAKAQVAKADFLQQLEAGSRALRVPGIHEGHEKIDGFIHRGIEQVSNTPPGSAEFGDRRAQSSRAECGVGRADFGFEDMRPITPPATFGAGDEDVAEELHFDLLEARATAAFALALCGVEAEGARVEPALAGQFRLGEQFADIVECADINRRIGAGSFGENGLVHDDGVAERFPAREGRGMIETNWTGFRWRIWRLSLSVIFTFGCLGCVVTDFQF